MQDTNVAPEQLLLKWCDTVGFLLEGVSTSPVVASVLDAEAKPFQIELPVVSLDMSIE